MPGLTAWQQQRGNASLPSDARLCMALAWQGRTYGRGSSTASPNTAAQLACVCPARSLRPHITAASCTVLVAPPPHAQHPTTCCATCTRAHRNTICPRTNWTAGTSHAAVVPCSNLLGRMQCSTSRAAEAAAQLRPRSRVPHARAAAPGSRRRGVASVRPTASSNAQASPQLASAATVVRLGITPLTPENFRPFGQVRPLGTGGGRWRYTPRQCATSFDMILLCARTATRARRAVQVVGTTEDGKVYDSEDAQLVLDRGTPRCAHHSIRTHTCVHNTTYE